MIALAIGAAAVVTAGAVGRRQRDWTALAEKWRRAHPVAADGIIPGAGPIALDGGARAVLLLHGFGDTPQTLALQAKALHDRGWTVRAPLLPGHGRTMEAFHAARAAQWTETVREAFDALAARHAQVAIVGLSMGGAMATALAAAAGDRAPALVLLAPFLAVSRRARWLTTLWPAWSLWKPGVCGDDAASIHDPVARRESLGYGCASPRSLRELRKIVDQAATAAAALRAPTLVIHSRTDYRIPVPLAARGYARLGAPVKVLQWVERSGHVITVDRDADAVTAATVAWLERYVPPGPSDEGANVPTAAGTPARLTAEERGDELGDELGEEQGEGESA